MTEDLKAAIINLENYMKDLDPNYLFSSDIKLVITHATRHSDNVEAVTGEKRKTACDAYLKDLEHGRMPHMSSFDHPPTWTNPDTAQAWEMAQQILMRCSLTPIEVDNIRVVHAYIKAALKQPDKTVDKLQAEYLRGVEDGIARLPHIPCKCGGSSGHVVEVLKGVRDALKQAAMTFRTYEENHNQKTPPDTTKAWRNRKEAEMCEEQLTALSGVIDGGE